MTENAMIKNLYEYRNQLPGDILFENSITAMMLVDNNRTITVVNNQFCALFGYDPEEVIGKRTSVLTPTKKHFDEYRKYFVETRDGSIKSSELQYKKKSGELFWVKLTGIAIDDGKDRYILWSLDDVSEEVKSRKEIHNRYLELDIIFNKVPTGLVYVVNNIIERANPVFLSIVGMENEEVIGKNIHTVLADVKIEKDVYGKELVRLSSSGETLSIEQEVAPITENSVIILFHNVTRHVIEKKELFNQARTDGLTRLLNKSAFQKKIQVLLDDPANEIISLAIFDIDFFKAVNDTHGHIIGDVVLTELASLLNGEVRKCEVLGRIGGEEFGLAFPVDRNSAVPICNRLLDCIRAQPFTEKQLNITVSMGLTDSTFSRQFDEIYKEADRLLYRAKQLGRNRIEFERIP